MRAIITLFLMLTIFLTRAQQIDVQYSKTIDPFIWTISWIEFKSNTTLISVRVKNTAFDPRVISFAQGEYIYSDNHPYGIRATKNSYQFHSSKKIVSLRHNSEISFILTFHNLQLANNDKFNLRLGTYFMLEDIRIPELTLSSVNKQMQTWDQYYNFHKKATLTYHNIDEVKFAIRKDVENWQEKGEFESTTAWKNRVNDITREQYVAKITAEYSTQHEMELDQIRREQLELAENYETYKKNILNKFYKYKITRATNALSSSNFELKPYDADNETFLIHNDLYGDILLPVPIAEAPSFKQNWYYICHCIVPEFVPNGEDVALNKLVFNNNGTRYTYDSHTVANYTITDVNYNFAPVEIEEINFADVKIDGISDLVHTISSSVVGINNQDSALQQTNVDLSIRRISASDKSDVDIAIPQNPILKNSTTFAVIIANEDYNSVSNVQFAENDGLTLAKYLKNTLGIPKEHIKVYKNATFGNIAGALKHIKNLSLAFGDKLNLLLYYAGHGVPNEQTKSCMLLPVDGDALLPETCYEVNRLYSVLGKLNAKSIVVMMDACFSGSLRGEGMLFASRTVKIKSNFAEPKGKLVIISASQGDETAFPFEKEQHGLFTYYLLKYLQENKGDVTLGDMSDYIIDQVKRQSVVTYGKLQTPMVQYSPEVGQDWKHWKLAQ